MQNLPVYLYPNISTVILDLDPDVLGVNRVMYQHDLKIQKGLKNQIRIQFKNSDQKRIPISSTATFVFNMFDSATQELVLQKNLSVLDDNVTTSTRGLGLLELSESDTLDLDRSSYTFSITYLDSDGTYLPTYTNTYYGISGTAQLLDDVYPKLKPSQAVVSFPHSFNSDIDLYEHKSGNVYAYPELNSNTALHTAAIYMTNFRGTVYVQATLSNTPASFGKYTTIWEQSYDDFTGVDYVNFTGVFTYVRFMFVPSTRPGDSTNDDPTYWGSLDKVLYRS
jgi:hypothetical protein